MNIVRAASVTAFRDWIVPVIVWGWFGLVSLELGSLAGVTAAENRLPNVILVLADDLGYGDVACLNPDGKIATPVLDRVASEGMVFTDAHSGSSVCSPTRYGILTGRYAWRSRLQRSVLGGLSPRLIEPGRLTLPQMLQMKGYHTACIGKWHLGMNWVRAEGKSVAELEIESRDQVWNVDYGRPIAEGPNSVGFHYYFGISASLDMVPYTYIENDRVTVLPTEDRDFPLMLGRPMGRTRLGPAAPGFDVTDVLPDLTAKAIRYVGERAAEAKNGQPFFLYLPLASPHTPIAPTKEWQGKSTLNPYADFVMQTDHAIGQLLDELDKRGLANDTLVIITSDNGCSPQADFAALAKHGHNPSHVFRGTKADIFDGGHRVPFLVRWPGRVRPNTKSSQLVCLTDFMATCAEIVGFHLSDAAGEDSYSFLPALRGESLAPAEIPADKAAVRQAIVHHSINGSFAIRDHNWKLELCPGSGGWSAPRPGRDNDSTLPPVQLYDLAKDIGETKNLEADEPEVVRRLTSLLEQYVSDGRSTPGAKQQNTVPVNIHRVGKAARSK